MLVRLFLTVQLPFASLLNRGDMANLGFKSVTRVDSRVW
jgi:hypothetical protein